MDGWGGIVKGGGNAVAFVIVLKFPHPTVQKISRNVTHFETKEFILFVFLILKMVRSF